MAPHLRSRPRSTVPRSAQHSRERRIAWEIEECYRQRRAQLAQLRTPTTTAVVFCHHCRLPIHDHDPLSSLGSLGDQPAHVECSRWAGNVLLSVHLGADIPEIG